MSAEPRRAAVLGKPIAHSKSPLLHSAAYRELGLDWVYDRYEVGESELEGFLERAGTDFVGFSLTMPLKAEAFRLCVEADANSQLTRACNTLVRDEEGWRGFNTDVTGFAEVLGTREFQSALVLGAGATARSALAALAGLGVGELAVAARRLAAAEGALAEVGLSGRVVSLEGDLPPTQLVVNTLPSGVADGLRIPSGCEAVFDVVYEPWPTRLAEAAAAAGIQVWSGLDLLVAQAVRQVLLMTGAPASESKRIAAAMRAALAAAD